ncbi:MLP-like protein 43 [Gossypium australe]|uniref:MLP-like protein 43 n=1 Tax=Gossypium australe TaxID=47621 RepID=A0A5B6WNX6_9ROSI|nr:MLP-like protein 43 [Gossypium australe]
MQSRGGSFWRYLSFKMDQSTSEPETKYFETQIGLIVFAEEDLEGLRLSSSKSFNLSTELLFSTFFCFLKK